MQYSCKMGLTRKSDFCRCFIEVGWWFLLLKVCVQNYADILLRFDVVPLTREN